MNRDKSTILLFRTEAPERRASIYKTVEYMALRGFHCRKIAEVCGITEGQVYTACGQMRIRLRDYRDGKGPVAEQVVRAAPNPHKKNRVFG